MDDVSRALGTAALLASLAAGQENAMDGHSQLLSGLRASSADTGHPQRSAALSARLGTLASQAQAIKSRAAARVGLHPDDIALLAAERGGLKAAFYAADWSAWDGQQ